MAWTNKEAEISEETNLLSDSVRIWTVNSSGLPISSSVYSAGTLFRFVTTDENDRLAIEYKDKLGRTILKKNQISESPSMHHDGWLCTYYVYDSFGKLRVVMPPKTISTLRTLNNWGGSTWNSNRYGLYYLYSYDERGRLISKKLPGKAPEEMVYDLQDRLVAFRDSMLIVQGKWLYTKYDPLGRVVMTGLVTNSNARSSLQSTLNTLGANNAIINSTSGKTGTTNAGGFPRATDGGEGEVLSVNYYDNYNFRNQ